MSSACRCLEVPCTSLVVESYYQCAGYVSDVLGRIRPSHLRESAKANDGKHTKSQLHSYMMGSSSHLHNVVNRYNPPSARIPRGRGRQLTLGNRGDLIRLGVRDFDPKLLLDGHYDLDSVERVEAEVGSECCGG